MRALPEELLPLLVLHCCLISSSPALSLPPFPSPSTHTALSRQQTKPMQRSVTQGSRGSTARPGQASTGNSPSLTACILHILALPCTSCSVLAQPSERVNSQQLSSQRRKRYVRTFFMQESAASIGLARARAQARVLALAFG